MKPAPAPKVPGKTPAERLSNAVKSIFKVSKEDLVKAEAKAKEKPDKPGRKTT